MNAVPAPPALREIADGTYAYLQPGGWGFSNAGLITSDGASLLVDTLYDQKLTARMLEAMRRASPAAAQIDTVVNTHANGDHCWGNALVASSDIVSSRAAAEEMRTLSPKLMAALVVAARAVTSAGAAARGPLSLLGRVGISRAGALAEAAPFILEHFGAFDFGGVRLVPPRRTFEGALTVQVGAKAVHLLEVGPAHTRGDVVVHVPSDRLVFTGDILFMGSHPIVWDGPVENWIKACDRIVSLGADTIVPGHGLITDQAGVREVRDYWQRLLDGCTRMHRAGLSVDEATRELVRAEKTDWRERSRMAVNVDTIYRGLLHDRSARDPLLLLARMARLERTL